MELGSLLDSVDGVVQEIMRLHRSLPPRPAIDEVEAAKDLCFGLLRVQFVCERVRSNQFNSQIQSSPQRLHLQSQLPYRHLLRRHPSRRVLQLAALQHCQSDAVYQGHKNTSELHLQFSGDQQVMAAFDHFASDKSCGVFEVELRMRLQVRFKLNIRVGKFNGKVRVL
ncbi:hypothetical protein QQ045_018929 [Rhodiola kirilowii]